MTNYTELKRLASAAKACAHLSYYTSHEGDFQVAASPDVVLSMIAEIDKLRTQNQALVKEMRHIAGISNGQVKRVADQALAAAAIGETME